MPARTRARSAQARTTSVACCCGFCGQGDREAGELVTAAAELAEQIGRIPLTRRRVLLG
jgi:hypothetical protein